MTKLQRKNEHLVSPKDDELVCPHENYPKPAKDARFKDCAIFLFSQNLFVLRLIENIVAGAGAVACLIESVHGAGSPVAQHIMIGRQGEIEGKIKRVKGLLDIC